MVDEKDRFGDKIRDVEKAREDQWAAQRDRELMEKLRAKHAELQHAAGEAAKALGKLCPMCHQPLTAIQMLGVEVMACPDGEGAWIDRAALSALESRLKQS